MEEITRQDTRQELDSMARLWLPQINCIQMSSTLIVDTELIHGIYREPESKQMLDPLGRVWQKWQGVGCLTSGRADVNKQRLFGSL